MVHQYLFSERSSKTPQAFFDGNVFPLHYSDLRANITTNVIVSASDSAFYQTPSGQFLQSSFAENETAVLFSDEGGNLGLASSGSASAIGTATAETADRHDPEASALAVHRFRYARQCDKYGFPAHLSWAARKQTLCIALLWLLN